MMTTNNAANFDEARWRRLTDADAAGVPLPSPDRVFLEHFCPQSPTARAEAQFFDALANLGDTAQIDDHAISESFVRATVEHVLADHQQRVVPYIPIDETVVARAPLSLAGTPQPLTQQFTAPMTAASNSRGLTETTVAPLPTPPVSESTDTAQAPIPLAPRLGRKWALVASAAAAIAIAWIDWPSADDASMAPPQLAASASVQPTTTLPEPAKPKQNAVVETAEPIIDSSHIVVTAGRLVDESGTVRLAQSTADGIFEVSSSRGCVALGSSNACFEQGARFEITHEQPHRITVIEGDATFKSSSPSPLTATVMEVKIAGDYYKLDQVVTIQTTAYSRKAAKVEIVDGNVTFNDADGLTVTLGTGTIMGEQGPKSSRSGAVPDAKILLGKARQSRSNGDRNSAIMHYEKLVRLYPNEPASKAAMVSVGDLYLDIRQPKSALKWFQRYLVKGGALAQEAHIGKIKALKALGRTQQEQDAIDTFLARYPSSRYAGQLHDRSAL